MAAQLRPMAEPMAGPAQPAEPAEDTATAATAAMIKTVTAALDANRIDLYLQPLVTLPQRKVRYYEVTSRIRDEADRLIKAADFIGAAEQADLMAKLDNSVMLRSVQVLRRLLVRNKDIGLFCNISAATLRDTAIFAQCLDFLEANRALASSFILEFKQSAFRNPGPLESEHLAALAQRGFRFSMDNLTDLRIEPRDLADRGVRFIKVPASLLLDQNRISTSDIHPADLSDLLGRFGIDLIAEKIENERSVVDLLDYDVRYGQGFLFASPRPLRADAGPGGLSETVTMNGASHDGARDLTKETSAKDANKPSGQASAGGATSIARPGPARGDLASASGRTIGNAALVRRAAGPN
jgi:cyclic-di-GMP phosphodiesterase TipF (flagellum assembly factor)